MENDISNSTSVRQKKSDSEHIQFFDKFIMEIIYYRMSYNAEEFIEKNVITYALNFVKS